MTDNELIIALLRAEQDKLKVELAAYKKYGFEPCDYADMRAMASNEEQAKVQSVEAIHELGKAISTTKETIGKLQEVITERDAAERCIHKVEDALKDCQYAEAWKHIFGWRAGAQRPQQQKEETVQPAWKKKLMESFTKIT